jgi:hypothetical protein
MCSGVRILHGKVQDAVTIYNPSISKPNKQSTQPGYMKRFGSRPQRVRRTDLAFQLPVMEMAS